jgi:hypothetical protein
MYGVWAMKRTNVYLSEDQLDALRRVGAARGAAVAELVREAIDDWLQANGVRRVSPSDWQRRFDDLLARRSRTAREGDFEAAAVERDVMQAVREAREARAARRR